ncbi:MAG: DUF2442 domain-containing protein [Rhodothermales bacterium]|nr:DUF2442 domain-containing protein [Rhodothermales bacterium]
MLSRLRAVSDPVVLFDMSESTETSYSKPGGGTFSAEVTRVDEKGIALRLGEEPACEFFLPYDRYPWFRYGSEQDVRAVERWSESHLHWEALQVDLHLDALRRPERYPLTSSVMPDLPLRVPTS